jgi:hypothetical protein
MVDVVPAKSNVRQSRVYRDSSKQPGNASFALSLLLFTE